MTTSVEYEYQENGIDFRVIADVSISWDHSYGAHPDLGGGRSVYEGEILDISVERFNEEADKWEKSNVEITPKIMDAVIEKAVEQEK
jgi:hypothetical protein